MTALKMAFESRKPAKGVIIHSDRGVQYRAYKYQDFMRQYGGIPSMSRQGNCWDNAVMESFYSRLKVELIYVEDYQTLDEAQLGIFEYIEGKMKHLKLIFCSILVITYSNIVWAANCDEVNAIVLEAMAKTFNVHADDIDLDKTFYDQGFDADVYGIIIVVVDVEEVIEVELKDEDVIDPMVYFDEEEYEPKIKGKVTVREFQEVVRKACVSSLI